jgi:hypothetical protein
LWVIGIRPIDWYARIDSFALVPFACDCLSRVIFVAQTLLLLFTSLDKRDFRVPLLIFASLFVGRPIACFRVFRSSLLKVSERLYFIWPMSTLFFLYAIIKSVLNRQHAAKLERQKRALIALLVVLAAVDGLFGHAHQFNMFFVGALSLFLAGFYVTLVKMNESHIVASTATCDSVCCFATMALAGAANAALQVFAAASGLRFAGDLVERAVVMCGVWLVVILGSATKGGVGYTHPGGVEIGSMDDDGIQDQLIDQLFPAGAFDNQTKLIDIRPTDNEQNEEFGDDILFAEFI